jgi:AcrR family transcriptional regulator
MMPTSTRRQSRGKRAAAVAAQDRRRWIRRPLTTELGRRMIGATVEEFASKGIFGARVSEITRRAGTTDPAFYRYFPSLKSAALFIMSEYYWAPLNQRLRHYRQITSEPVKLFVAVVEVLMGSAEDDPDRPWLAESQVFRIVVGQIRSPLLLPESLLDSEYLFFLEQLETILREGQDRGDFAVQLPPRFLAQLLVTVLHETLMLNDLKHQAGMVPMDDIRRVAAILAGLKDDRRT